MFSSAIQRLNDRRHGAGEIGEDAGFTLIELMVVLLILAILLAIAIPTFLGVTKSANDRATQSNLNTAIINAKAQYQSGGQTYWTVGAPNSASFATTLQSAEPALAFYAGIAGTGAATGTGAGTTFGSSGSQGVVSLNVSVDGNGLVLGAYSKSGNCFYEVDNTQTLTSGSTTVVPYTGTAITTTATALASGAIAMPTGLGTNYVEVKGDNTTSDCNAYTPKTNGTATVQYLTTGFPS
jgi:type IV pilus assembly protein PilA